MRLNYLHEDIAWEVRLFCEDKSHQPTVAVDLDGTLTVDGGFKGPDIIADPRKGARKTLTKFKEWGFRIIIFTVRGNTERIKEWLDEHDIPYDHINNNPDQPEDTSGKVLADLYIDDRAIDGTQSWSQLAKMVKKRLRARRAA